MNPWRRQGIIGSSSKTVSQSAASFPCLFFLPLFPANYRKKKVAESLTQCSPAIVELCVV